MKLLEHVPHLRAKVLVHVERAYAYDEEHGVWLRRQEEEDVLASNIVTNTGRVQLHTQGYGTTSLLTNGFNWIGLAASSNSPAAADTTLSSTQTGELSGNGLTRVQGVVVLPTGAGNQTTVSNTFTYTGGSSQAIGSTALFTASSGGVMNHEIQFTVRTLFTSDTITLTYTITLG